MQGRYGILQVMDYYIPEAADSLLPKIRLCCNAGGSLPKNGLVWFFPISVPFTEDMRCFRDDDNT